MKTLIAYVDGSYCNKTKRYSSGVVLLYEDEVVKECSFEGSDVSLISMRNVAGEIKASEYAMEWAYKMGFTHLIIHYDYEGVEKWCTGAWKAKKEGTQSYVFAYGELSRKIDITFIKVKAHSGDVYNDRADRLAKDALDIK